MYVPAVKPLKVLVKALLLPAEAVPAVAPPWVKVTTADGKASPVITMVPVLEPPPLLPPNICNSCS